MSKRYEILKDFFLEKIKKFHIYFENQEAIKDIRQITYRRSRLEEIYVTLEELQKTEDLTKCYNFHWWQTSLNDTYFACYDASLKAEYEFLKNQTTIPAANSTPASTSQQPSEKEVLETSSKAPPAQSSSATESSSEITIELPKFNGDYKKWRQFYEIFKSLVHDNEKIPQINKFQQLRLCLEGEDLSTVEFSTPSDYPTVWDTLVKKYEKLRLIVEAHLKELFDLPKLTNGSSLEICGLANNAQKHMNAIRAMNQATDDYLFVFLVASKLDKATRLQWELSSSDTELPSWNSFMEFLGKYSKALDESEPDSDVDHQNITVQSIFDSSIRRDIFLTDES